MSLAFGGKELVFDEVRSRVYVAGACVCVVGGREGRGARFWGLHLGCAVADDEPTYNPPTTHDNKTHTTQNPPKTHKTKPTKNPQTPQKPTKTHKNQRHQKQKKDPTLDLRRIHIRLIRAKGLNEAHWDQFYGHFKTTLETLPGVPADARELALKSVRTTREVFKPLQPGE